MSVEISKEEHTAAVEKSAAAKREGAKSPGSHEIYDSRAVRMCERITGKPHLAAFGAKAARAPDKAVAVARKVDVPRCDLKDRDAGTVRGCGYSRVGCDNAVARHGCRAGGVAL